METREGAYGELTTDHSPPRITFRHRHGLGPAGDAHRGCLGDDRKANEASVRRAQPDPEASPAQRDARRPVQRRLISS